MKKNQFLFLKLFVSVISVFIFWWLESGFATSAGDELIKSSIFGLSVFISLNLKLRKYLLWASLLLLILMVVFYLMWQVHLSERFGSIGLGILLIYVVSFLPNLIKKGFVEKL